MRTGILWILMTAFAGNTQLVSMRISGDTIYILNPSTGTQYKILPTAVGQSGKVLASDGTNYSWITNSSNVAWGAVTGTLSSQSDLNTALNGKLNISDTAAMVLGYLRKTGSAASLTNFPTLNQNTTGTAGGLSANIAESQVTSLVSDLALKAPLASPAFTGTPTGITATHVGLGNVTNESKATMFTSPTFTGTISGVTATHVGLGNVTNESKATMFTNATFTGTFTVPSSVITNANLAGSIDLTTKVTGILPFASNAGSTAATSATTGTMTVNMTTSIITITPTGACTFNGSGGVTGQRATFFITTSGVSSFNLTWGTNFRTTGVLATGTTTAKIFMVTFMCTNGTQWCEISRTAAM